MQGVTHEVPNVFSNGEHVRKMDTAGCGDLSGKGDRADDVNTNMIQN